MRSRAWYRPRRLAAKLVAMVLVAGLLPFFAVGAWFWSDAKAGMTEAVVESWLVRIARETAAQADRELERMRALVADWSGDDAVVHGAITALSGGPAGRFAAQKTATSLGRRAEIAGGVPFVGVVSRDGRILAAASSDRSKPAAVLAGRRLDEVFADPAERAWIDAAFSIDAGSGPSVRDRHRSPLADAAASAAEPDPRRNEVGFAAPLREPTSGPTDPASAALVVLFSMDPFQHVLDQVRRRFTEPDSASDGAARYPSGYPFLFAADADLVIGHQDRALLGSSLTRDHGQASFRDVMTARDYGFHRYEYPPGTGKISGFARCAGPDRGGFGWIVGVGVNDSDVYADVRRLGERLAAAAIVVAGVVVVFAGMFGSRMAGPLRRLVVHTERLARGDYDARVVVDSRDEVAILADALNRLAAELKESNRRLVEAEKNAAWKEMARQVAHEIKNPLTPIMLSAQQLERAHKDRHPRFDEILVESTRSIVEQCASLRRIAQNFAGFASFPQSRREPLAFGRLVRDAARLYAPKRDDGPGVVVKVDVPENVRILGDEDELRRVFLNLFNNAFEATGAEGALTIEAKVVGVGADAKAVAAVRDTGRGIPPEDKSRLFEPYFSTRTGGTGLGLAICRKIVSEHRGTIVCESAVGVGTTFVLTFPILKDDGSGADARPPDPFGETKTVVRT